MDVTLDRMAWYVLDTIHTCWSRCFTGSSMTLADSKADRWLRQGLGRLSAWIDPVSRGWIVVFSGSTLRLALGFVASVLIARSLGPAAFGIFAMLGAVGNITGVAADFGLTDTAIKRIAAAWAVDRQAAQELSLIHI